MMKSAAAATVSIDRAMAFDHLALRPLAHMVAAGFAPAGEGPDRGLLT